MLSNLKRYYRPKSIAEALALLEKNSGSILIIAGGTKLVKTDNAIVQELVDITALDLDYIQENHGVVRIGATTPIQKIVEAPELKTAFQEVLSEAARLTHVSKMVRNAATIGGELATTGPLSVLYCVLLVLQAQVRIAGGDEFALAMNIFKDKKDLNGGILVEVLVPRLRENTFVAQHTILQNNARPIITGAARVTVSRGKCHDVKLALSGTGRCPQRLHKLEEMFENQEFNAPTIEVMADEITRHYHPRTDALATEEFRKETGRIVLKKALLHCLDQAEENLGL